MPAWPLPPPGQRPGKFVPRVVSPTLASLRLAADVARAVFITKQRAYGRLVGNRAVDGEKLKKARRAMDAARVTWNTATAAVSAWRAFH